MLHVVHDNGRLLMRYEGSLDERGTDSVLTAVALTPLPVVVDLSRTTSISDCALARLSQVLRTRDVVYRGLRLRHERLLEIMRSGELLPLRAPVVSAS